MAAREFKKDDFGLLEGGIVRLSSATAREVAALTIKAVPLFAIVGRVAASTRPWPARIIF
jgi:hypothetical protein